MSWHLDERGDGSAALFIDGDLQFDTRDEAVYHESLALPALCLARPAGAAGLRVLICGGGDGLALRECLRFPGVAAVDLVDLSDEVVTLGRTRLAEFNHGAFDDPRARVTIGDAWEFVAAADPYDVIIADLTVPRRPEDARVNTVEWYARLGQALAPDGVAAINAVSPQVTPEGFWCLRRSIRAGGLFALGYRVAIPSFRDQGYGVWGFFLAAHRPLYQRHLRALVCPVPTRQADLTALWRGARFHRAERALETRVPAHSLARPCLVPLLLNPGRAMASPLELAADDPYSLERLLDLLPILHPYHTREMVETLAAEVVGTVRALDVQRLADELLRRAASLPRELVAELRALREYVGERLARLDHLGTWCYRVFAILCLVMTVANLLAPDNAFGKGAAGIGHASASRGISSFGGAHAGYGAGGRTTGSFAGRPGTGGSMGRGGSFASGSRARVTSSGFRGGYGRGRMVDVYGNTYEPRVFIYYHGHVHTSGYGYGNAAEPSGEQPQEQKALFAADDDVLVLENGDVVITLCDTAYLLASEGKLSLMAKGSPDALAQLYAEPALFEKIANDVRQQRDSVAHEIAVRRDWLSWVGWTSAFLGTTAGDKAEVANLEDLDRKLDAAMQRLGQPTAAAKLPAVGQNAVELFAGAFVLPDNHIALRQPDGTWLNTDGKQIWGRNRADAKACPPELAASLRSVMTKLHKELLADATASSTDLVSLDSDRAQLERDLAEYKALQAANGANYEVDYGTESIAASEAISRTERDLAQNSSERQTGQTTETRNRRDADRIGMTLALFPQ